MLLNIINNTDRPASGGPVVFVPRITRSARTKYAVSSSLSVSGQGIATEFRAARLLAAEINSARDLVSHPESALNASDISAINIIDNAMRAVISNYRSTTGVDIFRKLADFLTDKLQKDGLERLLDDFIRIFPPPEAVYHHQITASEYLAACSESLRAEILEDLVIFWLNNRNSAAGAAAELFSEHELLENPAYSKVFRLLPGFFRQEPPHPLTDRPLLQMLMEPIEICPDSMDSQLEYILHRWKDLIGDMPVLLLRTGDFIREEKRLRFDPEIFGPGPTYVPGFSTAAEEPEKFSRDLDWMPNVVLIAKNADVWLHQISSEYGRAISTLADIPNEALATLAERGFNALWLIGIWQRSRASERIKRLTGSPEAAASAYSLKAYRIADNLGGEAAYRNLRARAESFGLRLACDMVPNHTGLDSDWVCEHPDWFIRAPHPPFQAYSFNGENLSGDERVEVYLEDGYFNKTDAAVVYKCVHRETHSVRYIYHGNDGTHLPWNDTAQLNYLLPQVREAVIQEIIKLARMFPIIRFDAAMTLAKRHVRRLWYPAPGEGGDIASRSDYSLSDDEFEKAFPVEFWREVVDRVQSEVPDTLLLAEAFWMMEGYFVRTLGMHRVYNSAFMNMLKNEENAKYREVIRNVLDFNPQILKRYVNFMSNPDEETAIAQFGSDDKYFGCCLLTSTMPGTPMFAHGQVEGFREKYGMEYTRAYLDEKPNRHLIERHMREIAPLLRQRTLFSEVENFHLYDFIEKDGSLNENVFAYSNGNNDDYALIVFNNRFAEADGRIKITEATAAEPTDDSAETTATSGAANLGINTPSASGYIIFRDTISGLEYIISAAELEQQGLPLKLGAFKYHLFCDFRPVSSSESNDYAALSAILKNSGVTSIERELERFAHLELITALEKALAGLTPQTTPEPPIQQRLQILADSIAAHENTPVVSTDIIRKIVIKYRTDTGISALPSMRNSSAVIMLLPFADLLHQAYSQHHDHITRTDYIHERFLEEPLRNCLLANGVDAPQHILNIMQTIIFINHDLCAALEISPAIYFENLFSDQQVQHFTGINSFEDNVYFNKERFEELVDWLTFMALLNCHISKTPGKTNSRLMKLREQILQAATDSEYKLGVLLRKLTKRP